MYFGLHWVIGEHLSLSTCTMIVKSLLLLGGGIAVVSSIIFLTVDLIDPVTSPNA